MKDYMNLQRHTTNSASRIVFGLFFVFWIAFGTYVLAASKSILGASNDHTLEQIKLTLAENWVGITIRAIAGVFLFPLSLLWLQWASRGFVRVMCVMMWILFVLAILSTIGALFQLRFLSLPYNVFQCFLYYYVATNTSQVGIGKITAILNGSCRASFDYSTSFFISFFSTLIIIFLGAFAGFVGYYSFVMFASSSGSGQILPIVSLIITIIVGYWSILFVGGMAFMAMARAFSTWYAVEDKKTVCTADVNKEVMTTLSHHSGSACWGSSPIAWIRELQAVVTHKYDAYNVGQGPSKGLVLMTGLWLILSPSRIFTCLSFVMTALDGSDYYAGLKKSYVLAIKNPAKFLVLSVITQGAIVMMYVLVLLVLAATHIPFMDFENPITFVNPVVMILISLMVGQVFIAPPWSASLALILNTLNEDANQLGTVNAPMSENY